MPKIALLAFAVAVSVSSAAAQGVAGHGPAGRVILSPWMKSQLMTGFTASERKTAAGHWAKLSDNERVAMLRSLGGLAKATADRKGKKMTDLEIQKAGTALLSKDQAATLAALKAKMTPAELAVWRKMLANVAKGVMSPRASTAMPTVKP